MDIETLKTNISVVAAVVAVVSATLAHRAKVQTRRDLFDGQRNELILQIVENDCRCEHLALQAAFARAELDRIEINITSTVFRAEHAKWIAHLQEAEALTKSLEGREYTPEKLDALEYTEEGLTTLRRMTRGEQANARRLSAESYDLIFAALNVFVARHEAEKA